MRGEPHGYADHDTEIMLYGERDAHEFQVALALQTESRAFASQEPDEQRALTGRTTASLCADPRPRR